MPETMYKLPIRRMLVIALFAVFLFLRLFVSHDSVLLSSDNLKFMEAAKNFPYHTLYNGQIYLLHPPLYPYAIHFFTLIFNDDYTAAVVISIISAIVTFFVLYHLFMMLTGDFSLTCLILLFFTLSNSLIVSARVVARESSLIMLATSSIYFYIKGVKSNNKKYILFAALIGSALAASSDHVVFLFPALILSYIFFNREKVDLRRFSFPNIWGIILPLLIISLFYGSWTLVKYHHYSNSEYYVNGYEGTPVNTRDLGLLQLISPQNFEDYGGTDVETGTISAIKRTAFNLGYMLNMEPFSIPRGLNFSTMGYLLFPRHIAYMAIIYLPLSLVALFGIVRIIYHFIKTRKAYGNVGLYALFIFLIFAFPITQKFSSPKYVLVSYIFLYYIISFGLISLLQKIRKWHFYGKYTAAALMLLLLLIPFWYYYNPNFVFSLNKFISAQKTGDFINANIPKDAVIMAQPGYTAKLIYLTGNKIIGLHHDPEKLPYLIELYNVSYAVTGKFYTEARGLSRESVDHIMDNPEKFELIGAINEDYSGFFVEEDFARTDRTYIYKIKRE